jgi:hypothetical protein
VQSYSITTNQAAIIALFRVINRYVGNLPPMTGTLNAETLILAPGSCAVSFTLVRRRLSVPLQQTWL